MERLKATVRPIRKKKNENMNEAYKAVKCGKLSISAAAKQYDVPRMTLSDRIIGKVKLDAKMGPATALNIDEEQAFVHYMEYMPKNDLPLTLYQIMGFALCIANEGKTCF